MKDSCEKLAYLSIGKIYLQTHIKSEIDNYLLKFIVSN
jgi:hypothetical protein